MIVTLTQRIPGLRSVSVDGEEVTLIIDAVEASNPAPGGPDDPTGQKCVQFKGTTKIGGIRGALQAANDPSANFFKMRVFKNTTTGDKSVMRILANGEVVFGYKNIANSWTFRTFPTAARVLEQISYSQYPKTMSAVDIIYQLITANGSITPDWTDKPEDVLTNLRGWNGACK